jgi:hypothetical protein
MTRFGGRKKAQRSRSLTLAIFFFFQGKFARDEHKNRFGVSFYPKINAVAENISNWTFLQYTIE